MESIQTTFKVGGSYIYGRSDDVNRIIDLLSSEDGTHVSSTFVSVVADRGTGRTTLLHLLHNALCNAFDKRKFICMPEKFDEMRLMRVIIESLTSIPCDITDLEVLEETVKEELRDQRLLLLLDNFENKSQKCWDLLAALLKVCKEKSAVVVTATRKAVAEVKGPMQFYYMNNLSDELCLMIFKQSVFKGQNPDADTELADIGNCLVAKCRNVTLCIKVLSGLLRHSIPDDCWMVVLNNNFWEMDEEEGGILPALRVCYQYLPHHLKQCFKYCSLFPKEYIFSKKLLVHLWSSEGFVEPGEGRDIEDIGLEYFDELLSLSFFQPSLIPDRKEDKFVMPGLIHDLAQQLSKNECFRFEGCVQRAPENICHLSLVAHAFQSVSLNHLITRAQNLRTFLVVSRSTFQDHISSCLLNLVELDDLFVKFCSLVTLNLNNADIEELPETFGSLTNLRYLSFSGTNIKRIPLEISNLIHLQTLEAKDCHYLEELPRTIEVLTNLRYLDVSKELGSVVMPRGIGKLTNLRSLATFNIGMDPLLHCGIEELKDMVHLKGCFVISGLINVRGGIDAKESHIRSKEHIETLFLHWNDGKTFEEGDEGTEIAEDVLQSLYPTDNIKEIIIRDYPGNTFPMWVECAHFFRLVSIIFDHCYNCERLPDLGKLQSLKFLSIRKMYSVQKLNLSNSEHNLENNVRYPSLEQLTIWEMYELVEWVEIGNRDFPALKSLHISSCPLLRNIPRFPSLVELSVYSGAQFLESMHLQSLQSLRIEGLQKIKSVKLSKLVGLKKLEINHCPEPLSIEGLPLLSSLEKVIIFRCPQLDFHDILDRRLFTFEERGNTSVWLCEEKLTHFGGPGPCNEGQDHPFVLNIRKDRQYLRSLLFSVERHARSLDLSSRPSTSSSYDFSSVTSFRIHGSGRDEIESLCHSLGLSGTDDFGISVEAWEAACQIRSVDNTDSHDKSPLAVCSTSNQDELKVFGGDLGFRERSGQVGEEHNGFYRDTKASRIRPTYLDEEDDEEIVGFRSGETTEGTSPLSTTNDDETSSTNTEAMFVVSPNERFKKKIRSWMRGALLGHGSFGMVYEGISDEGVFFAVKEVSLVNQGSNAKQCIIQLEQEVALLSQFEHENIVQYYGTDKEEAKLYIFLELVTNGSLASLYEKYRLRDIQVSAYTRQILKGLEYLHEKNIVHGDIKCANILVHANGSVKLADFGLAKKITKMNNFKSWKGSTYWMAPEVVNPNTYGSPADIWSLGCTVLEMLTRQLPYPHLEWTQALFQIGRGVPPPIPTYLSKEVRSFISQCVRVDPFDRPSASELLDHPFVKGSIQFSQLPASPHHVIDRWNHL